MGWKCSFIVAREGNAPLAALEQTDPAAARSLASKLLLRRLRDAGSSSLDIATFPFNPHEVYLTAAPGLGFVSDADALDNHVTSHATDPLLQSMLRAHPTSLVGAFELHSVTNWWAFALYDQGRFVRAFAGAADEGIIINEGTPIPEEAAAGVEDPGEGEAYVFAVAARFFDRPLDQAPLEQWTASRFLRAPWWRFW